MENAHNYYIANWISSTEYFVFGIHSGATEKSLKEGRKFIWIDHVIDYFEYILILHIGLISVAFWHPCYISLHGKLFNSSQLL